jgi:hypothetical protein
MRRANIGRVGIARTTNDCAGGGTAIAVIGVAVIALFVDLGVVGRFDLAVPTHDLGAPALLSVPVIFAARTSLDTAGAVTPIAVLAVAIVALLDL